MLSKNEFNFTKNDEKVLPVSFKKNNVKILQNLQNYHSYKNLNKMSFQIYIFCRSFKRKCITMDRWHIFTFHEVYLNLRRQNHWQNIFLLYFDKEIQLK